MSEPIRLLHISDLHASGTDKQQMNIRLEALFEDLVRLQVKIDVVLFTGDIAFSGKSEQYEIAERMLLDRFKRQFNIPKNSIYIIPGNHDVDRSVIDSYAEKGLGGSIKTSEDAEPLLDHPVHGIARLQGYYDFVKNYYKEDFSPYHCVKQEVKGITIGFARFNSAWRCSGDTDQNQLFITSRQVLSASEQLENCHFKIALVHHPLDWLHPSENDEVVPDLKRTFDLIVSGHLHLPSSEREFTPQSDCLMIAAPALSDHRQDVVGYNLYELKYQEKTLLAKYRKFYRKRCKFGQDAEHADNGEQLFQLPVHDLILHSHGSLCQRIADIGTEVQKDFYRSLSKLQEKDDPIYVTPPVQKVTWNAGNKESVLVKDDLTEIAQTCSVLYGGHETGKTLLLQSLTTAINQRTVQGYQNNVAIYVDLKHSPKLNIERRIKAIVAEHFGSSDERHQPSQITFLFDHVNIGGEDYIDVCRELSQKNSGWNFVFALDNQIYFDSLLANSAYSSWSFFTISQWGPGRIREFIKSYFSDKNCDIDVAFHFILRSLRDCDLPATPIIVVLYASVFRLLGDQRSSLSFLNLLQTVERHRLGHIDNSAANSLYNKQRVLEMLASECVKRGSTSLPKADTEKIVIDYFRRSLITVNAERFIDGLIQADILEALDQEIAFKTHIFFDYYLANAFKDQIADVNKHTVELHEVIKTSNALALYGGLLRENEALPKQILSLIEGVCKPNEVHNLQDLDKFITDLLLPSEEASSANRIVTEDINSKVDYYSQDDAFAKSRDGYSEERKNIAKIERPKTNYEHLSMLVFGLKSFYNIFRNLEMIDGDDKVLLLDRILDFHIHCNIQLIEFFREILDDADFQTFFAYIVTLDGMDFLSSNIGNQSLQGTIEASLELCGENDFKELLLLFLYSDLRLPGHENKLAQFTTKTTSRAAVEMVYIKLRQLMVHHEKQELPSELISAFTSCLKKRSALAGEVDSRGAIQDMVNKTLQRTQKVHLTELSKSNK